MRTLRELLEALGSTDAKGIEVGESSPNTSVTESAARTSGQRLATSPAHWAKKTGCTATRVSQEEKKLLITNGATETNGGGVLEDLLFKPQDEPLIDIDDNDRETPKPS
jgi:hypothetical protein